MIFTIRLSGVIANVALIMNVLLVFASSLFAGTLPSLALQVGALRGMAVDANILVHERIKEELRWGKTTRAPLTRLSPGFTTINRSN